MHAKFVAFDAARFPEVDVQDIKGSTDGPREGQLAAFADGVSGEYAASTFFAPCMYVGGDTRPEESLSDTMKGLVRAEVAGAGGGVVGSENGAS